MFNEKSPLTMFIHFKYLKSVALHQWGFSSGLHSKTFKKIMIKLSPKSASKKVMARKTVIFKLTLPYAKPTFHYIEIKV